MNYGELKTAVIEDTHRADLTTLVPRFIREAEGMIRRDMNAYLLTVMLAETDRSVADSPIYNLPDGVQVIRRIAVAGQQLGLRRMSLDAVGAYPLTDNPHSYGEAGDDTVEFRGNPATDAEFTLNYYGMPAELADDADTNSLLDENETLYKSGAMFNLYQHTQDRELAQDALSIFENIIENLNEQVARKIGGATITESYNFSGGSSY